MSEIKVAKVINPTVSVRLGQQNVIKPIPTIITQIKLEDISDMNTDGRTNQEAQPTLVMFDNNTNEYVHVQPSNVLDLTDGTVDNAVDYGTF
jgi:hypothetical protein